MTVWIDTGHGVGNTGKPGVFDPGASSAYGQEAVIVRTVAAELVPKLKAKGIPCDRAPDGSITSRMAWQAKTLQTGDLFVSLHMNSGAFSGTSVYYPADKPHLHDDADQLAADLAAHLGTKNEGGRPDTETAVKRVGVLHANAKANQLLLELGRVGYEPDVKAVLAKGADAVVSAIARLLGLYPTLTPEEQGSWDAMRAKGIFSQYTNPDDPITARKLAVFLHRALGN